MQELVLLLPQALWLKAGSYEAWCEARRAAKREAAAEARALQTGLLIPIPGTSTPAPASAAGRLAACPCRACCRSWTSTGLPLWSMWPGCTLCLLQLSLLQLALLALQLQLQALCSSAPSAQL